MSDTDPRPYLCGCVESRELRALLAEAATHLDHLRWLMVQEPPANRAKLADLLARIRALETK
jgi:hypothetical protein